MKEREFKGVILDFDGVLGDTERLQKKKWDLLLGPYEVNISETEYITEYCGKSSATEIPKLLKEGYPQIPFSEKELAEKATQVLKGLFEKEAQLMPGALETLEFFKREGFKMAVCSAKNPEELEMKLSSVGLSEWFPLENRSTQSEAGGLPKPHPVMYQLACRRLGLSPKKCLAFEDTQTGVESAASAGLYVIAMPNEWSESQDFSKANRIIYGWPAFLKDPQI